MTHEDLVTLGDVYEELNTDFSKKTTYVLQFLWRDISSHYDLIGPYFTSSDGLDSRFTLACLYETMQCLESVGFRVKGLICDGASWNLSMLKRLCKQSTSTDKEDEGATDKEDEGEVRSQFFLLIRFLASSAIIIVNCPSHEAITVHAYMYIHLYM